MPINIDMSELKKFIYEMNFNGNKVKALDSEGYYHAAYPYLRELKADLVFGPGASVNNGTVTYCVAKAIAVIEVDGVLKTFSALGCCGSNESRIKPEHMADVAETRAMKRVLHRALDMSKFDIREDVEAQYTGDGDSAPTKPPSTLNDLSVPAAVASGEAGGMPRKSKLPSSGDDGVVW
jgi:hypothetical protein